MLWILGAWAAIVPASEVSFEVAVSGTIAEIEVRQRFRNDSRHRVDATYRFPLHDDAVVDGMQIRLDDRTIDGVIEEKEAARKAYEEAVAQGKTAALTETERWNVYLQQVGNIPPGAELEVVLRIVQPVDRTGRTYELSLPVGDAGSFGDDTPPVPADIALEIDAGLPLTGVECVTHDAFEAPTGDAWTVLVSDADPERGPVVVRWELADPEAQIGAVYDERHVMLVFEPPLQAVERRRRRVVLLGELAHSRTLSQLAGALQAAGPVEQMHVPEVPSVLRSLLKREVGEEASYIVVVSDGLWGDAEALLDDVIDTEHQIYTVAAGPRANRFVLDELAQRGGGRTFSTPVDLSQVAQLLDRPTLSDIEVDWGDWGDAELSGGIRDVHLGDPVQVLARTTYADGGVIEVSGIVGSERQAWRVEPRAVAQGRALGSTWARGRIETLGRQQVRTGISAREEGLPLALEYGILSPWTAFVAIDPRQHTAELPDDALVDSLDGEDEEKEQEEEEISTREEAREEPEDTRFARDKAKDDDGRTVIDFSDMDITGELMKPQGSYAQPSPPPPPAKAKKAKPREYRAAPTGRRSTSESTAYEPAPETAPVSGTYSTDFKQRSGRPTHGTLPDGSVVYMRKAPELLPMRPPPARGAVGLGGYIGTDVFGLRGGYDRTRVDDGVWRQVPFVLDASDPRLHGQLGYRFQRLTAADRTQPDRRRHAVDLDVAGSWEGGWYRVSGLGQQLTCDRCDPARALALAAEGGARFGEDTLRGRIGLRGALSDFRAGSDLVGGRTGFAISPVLGASWTPRRFRAVVEVAPGVANPDGLRFVPTASAELGPRLGDWHVQLGGGQRVDTDRPVWGVPLQRRGWLGVGYGEGAPWLTLRGGVDQAIGPYAPRLEQLEALPTTRWQRTAVFGELAVARSEERWHLGWVARGIRVLRSEEDLDRPIAPYVPGLLLAHRPFYTGGELGVSAQHTHLRLKGGLASPLGSRGWWGRWQAHGSLGAVQELGSAGRIGLGGVFEAWSGRPGDVDPNRLDGWVSPDRAGIWAARLELSIRMI